MATAEAEAAVGTVLALIPCILEPKLSLLQNVTALSWEATQPSITLWPGE